MSLSAKQQQVNNWSVWCWRQTQLPQSYIVTAQWPTNGLQRLILRIPSQQFYVMSPGSAGTHVCMHACTHTLIHVYINIMIHKYNV